MNRIMFVCHGNICRSPLAEFVMKDMVEKAGLSREFYIASSATSTEEIGNPVYPPVKRLMRQYGLPFEEHFATQLKSSDYRQFDLFILMDHNNLRNIKNIFDEDPQNKIHLLLSYTPQGGQVADPWYSGDFEAAYRDILRGCKALLDYLKA